MKNIRRQQELDGSVQVLLLRAQLSTGPIYRARAITDNTSVEAAKSMFNPQVMIKMLIKHCWLTGDGDMLPQTVGHLALQACSLTSSLLHTSSVK